jgi:hypothetical protein
MQESWGSESANRWSVPKNWTALRNLVRKFQFGSSDGPQPHDRTLSHSSGQANKLGIRLCIEVRHRRDTLLSYELLSHRR